MISLLLAIIYLSFISLGLPDSLLGAAWPSMSQDLGARVSYAGIVSMIIALGTVISSLQGERLTRRFGTGLVTAGSVALTAAALLGFSLSGSFLSLCLWAVPYGLGAGSVDAALNNYVALHYASRHMSWLHCMWGVGASIGPWIMGRALGGGLGWESGYRVISFLQIALTTILFLTLPLWHKESHPSGTDADPESVPGAALTLSQIFRLPGARESMASFFCYSLVEQTINLWAGSYLVLGRGFTPESAARFASLFFLGITAGRFLSGFLTIRMNDIRMIRMGQGLIALGVLFLFLPLGNMGAGAALLTAGLGCAPVFPCLIHSTPRYFGPERSQALIGVQMASAYTGTCLMPPLFGLIATRLTISLLPLYLAAGLLVMTLAHERIIQKTSLEGETIS